MANDLHMHCSLMMCNTNIQLSLALGFMSRRLLLAFIK